MVGATTAVIGAVGTGISYSLYEPCNAPDPGTCAHANDSSVLPFFVTSISVLAVGVIVTGVGLFGMHAH